MIDQLGPAVRAVRVILPRMAMLMGEGIGPALGAISIACRSRSNRAFHLNEVLDAQVFNQRFQMAYGRRMRSASSSPLVSPAFSHFTRSA